MGIARIGRMDVNVGVASAQECRYGLGLGECSIVSYPKGDPGGDDASKMSYAQNDGKL